MIPQAGVGDGPPSNDVLDLVRALPADAVRVLLDALRSAGEGARCAEAQADGTPCASVHSDCARCRRFLDAVDRVGAAVEA